MSVRVQVILDEQEAARFRRQAQKETMSLSRWLRESGNIRLDADRYNRSLRDEKNLKEFFRQCDERDQGGVEPDWEEHKKLISDGYAEGSQI